MYNVLVWLVFKETEPDPPARKDIDSNNDSTRAAVTGDWGHMVRSHNGLVIVTGQFSLRFL